VPAEAPSLRRWPRARTAAYLLENPNPWIQSGRRPIRGRGCAQGPLGARARRKRKSASGGGSGGPRTGGVYVFGGGCCRSGVADGMGVSVRDVLDEYTPP
jgi:hypothetical protein